MHERGGPKDKILYNLTLLLGLAVAAELLEFTYRGIFGKKWRTFDWNVVKLLVFELSEIKKTQKIIFKLVISCFTLFQVQQNGIKVHKETNRKISTKFDLLSLILHQGCLKAIFSALDSTALTRDIHLRVLRNLILVNSAILTLQTRVSQQNYVNRG